MKKRKREDEKIGDYDLNFSIEIDELDGIRLDIDKELFCSTLMSSDTIDWDVNPHITNPLPKNIRKYQKEYANRHRLTSFGRKLEAEGADVFLLVNDRTSGESMIYSSPFYRNAVQPDYKELYIKTNQRKKKIIKDDKMDIDDDDDGDKFGNLTFTKKKEREIFLMEGNGTQKDYASQLYKISNLE